MPLSVQGALLRVLETGDYMPIGSNKPKQLRHGSSAPPNIPLDELVAKGEFRADLRYRLQRLPIIIPPLAKRTADILPLAEHFLNMLLPHEQPQLSEELVAFWQGYDWPVMSANYATRSNSSPSSMGTKQSSSALALHPRHSKAPTATQPQPHSQALSRYRQAMLHSAQSNTPYRAPAIRRHYSQRWEKVLTRRRAILSLIEQHGGGLAGGNCASIGLFADHRHQRSHSITRGRHHRPKPKRIGIPRKSLCSCGRIARVKAGGIIFKIRPFTASVAT